MYRAMVALAAALFATAPRLALAEDIGLKRDLTYKAGDGFVEVLKNGQMVARYIYKNTPRPYIYPIVAPDGPPVTRGYPMDQKPGEPTDHPHHRSFWVGFGNVDGVDFWTEGDNSGKIVQREIDFDSPSPGYWNIHTRNDWIAPDGKVVCYEDRRYSFLSCAYGLLISTRIELIPAGQQLTLGGTKEGFLAFRLAQGMQLKDGTGHILNSEGHRDLDCWGKRARWVDYTGQVEGKTVGIAVFDVPSNYGFPTYWHARDYGLLAANPFGGKDFTGDGKSDSSLTIRSGQTARFVYIALIHPGAPDAQKLEMIAEQVAGKAPSVPAR